jgi:hypothetical protein
MPLTLPNLDDRTYADLVEEARALLVANAPALTNHNPSDPLITLVEMFAYFTEVLVFRLNGVTDANRRAFLRLLNGPDPHPDPRKPALTGAALDAEVRRTVLNLRTIDRATTAADYELLALTHPDVRIARAKCIPEIDLSNPDPVQRLKPRPSHVSVVILPFVGQKLDDALTDVADRLEPRRLLATRVHVVPPRTVPVSVQLSVHLLPDARVADVRARVVDALGAWFDPMVGGRDGQGWPFGRTVYVSEIYALLDSLAGVDFVARRTSGNNTLEELRVPPEFTGRRQTNADNELIGFALEPDELVKATIDAVNDIKFEVPQS